MFRHLLQLTWKRKARHLMLSLEILIAFAVVFAIVAFAVRSTQLYRMPIGFAWDNAWSVRMRAGDVGVQSDPLVYDHFRRALLELPEVESVAFATLEPFTMSTMNISVRAPASGARVNTEMMEVSDDYAATAGIALAEGRWFSSADDGAAEVPVVINRAMAQAIFGDGPVLGKRFTQVVYGSNDETTMQVVGVVADFRAKGELAAPVNFIFARYSGKSRSFGMESILLKVKPGTERIFETKLNRQLLMVRNDWSYQISPLALLRTSIQKSQLTPLVVLAVIAAFMLLMVGFGLFGVLWQNVTQRIPEIGLRRALGASAGNIYRQILAEQLLLCSAAMAVGLLLLVQLPLTGALGKELNWQVFSTATLLSMAVIYLLSFLCALYPGWRASRLSPTEALHYE